MIFVLVRINPCLLPVRSLILKVAIPIKMVGGFFLSVTIFFSACFFLLSLNFAMGLRFRDFDPRRRPSQWQVLMRFLTDQNWGGERRS